MREAFGGGNGAELVGSGGAERGALAPRRSVGSGGA